jgi:hypothetical protein
MMANGEADQLPRQRTEVPVKHGQERYPNPIGTRKVLNPLNMSHNYPGGMQTEFDSTPGYERIRIYHPSGSFTEIRADGARVEVSQGNKFDYSKQGYTLTIDQNGDVSLKGHSRLSIEGGVHMEVKGNMHSVVMGDHVEFVSGNKKSFVMGNSDTHVGGALNQSAKTMTQYSGGEMSMKGTSIAMSGDVAAKDGSLTHNDVDVGDTHTHGGVMAGSDDTEPPVA